jgi:hypothetical protein
VSLKDADRGNLNRRVGCHAFPDRAGRMARISIRGHPRLTRPARRQGRPESLAWTARRCSWAWAIRSHCRSRASWAVRAGLGTMGFACLLGGGGRWLPPPGNRLPPDRYRPAGAGLPLCLMARVRGRTAYAGCRRTDAPGRVRPDRPAKPGESGQHGRPAHERSQRRQQALGARTGPPR